MPAVCQHCDSQPSIATVTQWTDGARNVWRVCDACMPAVSEFASIERDASESYTPSSCDDCQTAIGTDTGWAEPRIGADGRAFLCFACADAYEAEMIAADEAADEAINADLRTIDAVADLLVSTPAMLALHPDATERRNAAMRGLRVLFPYAPDTVLAERLAAAVLNADILTHCS